MNIRDDIVEKRRARIRARGHTEGADVPRRREAPLVPFLGANGLICEVKRRSPSKGDIAPGLDAVAQAGLYVAAGAGNLSVLTQAEGFGGSLDDLLRVKRHFPSAAVLRKDFLFDPEDIDVAWRAGADAVLLIAGMLDAGRLAQLYAATKKLGMEALVEVHDDDDLAKARYIKPDLVGVNSRDLTTFRIDPLLPVKVKAGIDWTARVVYESGISAPNQAAFAIGAGFGGILVGEGVVRNPALAPQLLQAMAEAESCPFWPDVGRRLRAAGGRPLVKICGLCREEDARMAADAGADILGFVFHPASPRAAKPALVRSLGDVGTMKVGVVVNEAGAKALPEAVLDLLRDGRLDAVQFHGDETPDDCARLWPAGYKALRPGTPEEAAEPEDYRCPRVLLDAFAPVPGGSGKRVRDEVLDAWRGPLWLAGGITAENVGPIVEARRPELIDVASGIEAEPGVKDVKKMSQLLRACC